MSKPSSKGRANSYFESQRDLLIAEISTSMDAILNNVNALNRSLESSIAVGKEFEGVSTLWSTFYDGMQQMEKLRQQALQEQQLQSSESTNSPETAAAEPEHTTDKQQEGTEST